MKALFFCITTMLVGLFGHQLFPANKNNKISTNEPYPPTILPKDTTLLWFGEGSLESDTVLIINEGGPKTQSSFEYNGKTQWSYLPKYFNYYRANMHQVLTYNNKIVNFKGQFTRAMAEKEIDNNSEMLYRAFKYFKDRNKTVIVIGHSFGAYTIPHCMTTRPLEADGYLLTGGRIDDPLDRSSYFLKGYNSKMKEDGITWIPPDTTEAPNSYRGERYFKIFRVKQLMKGVIGQPRFSKTLANKDLSKMIYFYAKDDQNVGSLLQPEIDFLKSKSAYVQGTEGGHYEIWKRVIDAFEEKKVNF